MCCILYNIGGACRTKVNRVLAKKFATPLLAEEFHESGATEESSSTEQLILQIDLPMVVLMITKRAVNPVALLQLPYSQWTL